jgi:pyruvate dehydrogenase E1 component alpha subunit
MVDTPSGKEIGSVNRDLLVRMYRTMYTIRRAEERIIELYKTGLMHGMDHPCIGQEAVAAGVCLALRREDAVISTHRGHGHYIAKGGDLPALMAELLGRASGCCRGKGGTMHLADTSVGLLSSTGIVGGGLAPATGVALAEKMQASERIAVCFFGDGAANQGVLFEVLNMAALWKLPILYVCENNQFGEFSPMEWVTAGESLAARAQPFGVPGRLVDGNDAMAVYDATLSAADHARHGRGPVFLECRTYRVWGHNIGDQNRSYRDRDSESRWLERDPLRLMSGLLADQGMLDEGVREQLELAVEEEIDQAIQFAKDSPFPSESEVYDCVYA